MKKIFPFFLFIFIFPFFLSAQPNAPEWAKGIVWYQIFPERFANGDESNDPHPEKVFINRNTIPEAWGITPWTKNWFAQQEWEKKLGGNFRNHLYSRRYGGDIQGIIDRLDYLKELGVGAIYLNPVFEAVSLHKYDGSTFHHIDVNFGPDPLGDIELISKEIPDDPSTWVWTSADKLFLKLIEEVHARGMRIIIDGVFNHVGEQFWAFQDVVEKQEESIYKDWFLIKSFDDPSTEKNEFDYKGWWNIKSLPEFNRTENDIHHGPKQYVFHATERWMDPNGDGNTDDGIDGWRLDVARDVPLGFWKEWNRLVKSINSEAILIGELWELSPDFISQDGAFDALMNYNFAYAVKELFIDQKKKIDVNTFRKKLKEIDETYPEEFLHVLQNLMGSHDTERLSSLILNPDKDYDRDGNEDNPNYNPGKPGENEYEIQKLVAAFQMTYKGAPMIYYGDEVGMWGADDPHDRKPMVWNDLKYEDEVITKASGFSKGFGTYTVEQNEDLLNFYKKIISIRNSSNALKKGDVSFIYSNENKRSFVFERNFENDKIIAAFNLGNELDSIALKLDLKNFNFVEMIENGEGSVVSGEGNTNFKIQIPGMSVRVYKIYSN